jgi:hypothetical protein
MSAMRPIRKMITPPIHAVLAAMGSPENLRAQGDTKSSAPQIRLIQSWTFFAPPRNEALFAISNLLHHTRRWITPLTALLNSRFWEFDGGPREQLAKAGG